MDKLGITLFGVLLFSIYLSLIYIPHNQLTVHRASARAQKIMIDNPFNFTLSYLNTGEDHSNDYPIYLFIHGHKGSWKQAISMTKFFENHGAKISMYTIDFNEGAVGISYSLLLAEVDFTVKCIEKLHSINPKKNLIILAHSFGGIIGSLALKLYSGDFVKGMIALSTPFEAPPITNDIRITWKYAEIHKFWHQTDMFVISITGGVRDLTVPSQLTNIRELGAKNSIHAYSTEMSGLHKEIDHVAMVWGHEFFEELIKIIQACNHYKGAKLIKKIKGIIQSDISRMVNNMKDEPVIYIVSSNSSIEFSKEKTGIKLGQDYFYMLNEGFETEIIKDNNEKVIQKIVINEVKRLTLLQAFIGVNLKVPIKENLATLIRLGPDFSTPRMPLRVTVLGEGQSKAMHAHCGHEEIIKYDENDFVLYFHEYCKEGPEIWIFGYDTDFEYILEIKIDILGCLVCLARDFRIHIFACMFFLALSCTLPYSKKVYIASFLLFYVFGSVFRNYPFAEWEKLHDQEFEYSLIDVAYIICGGRGLYMLLMLLFRFLRRCSKIASLYHKWLLILLPFAYTYPWPVVTIYLLLLGRHKNTHFIALLTVLSMLPQNVGWCIAFFTHNIHEVDAQVVPVILFMISQLMLPKVCMKYELTILSFIVGLFVHDLLYRSVIIFNMLCIWLVAKGIGQLIYKKLI